MSRQGSLGFLGGGSTRRSVPTRLSSLHRTAYRAGGVTFQASQALMRGMTAEPRPGTTKGDAQKLETEVRKLKRSDETLAARFAGRLSWWIGFVHTSNLIGTQCVQYKSPFPASNCLL